MFTNFRTMSIENDLHKYKSVQKPRRLTFQSKLKIYTQFHLEHSSIISIARKWNISKDTVLSIVHGNAFEQKNIILKAKHDIPSMPTSSKTTVEHAIYEMEKLLGIWIEDQYQRNVPVTGQLIKAKATELYSTVQQGNTTTQFQVDEKWLTGYRNRTKYINLELPSESDINFLKQFPAGLKTLIDYEKYLKDQIFNVNRMLLFWKNMPDGTYISREAEEMANNRITLLLGCNASGECKLQPLTIYNSDLLLSVKDARYSNIHQKKLPNATSSLTPAIFEEWFIKDFIPAVKFYCHNKGIAFKILLLLDTALCFSQNLIELHPNVRVVFLPRIISRKYQPMEQGVKSLFKANYLHLTLNMVAQATRGDTDITVQDFCESYTIQKGVCNITNAWTTIPQRCLRTAWRNICPQFMDCLIYTKPEEELLYQDTKKKILAEATLLGFEIDMDDVENLIQCSGAELSYQDLVVMAKCIAHEGNEMITVDLTDELDSEHSSDACVFSTDCIEVIEGNIPGQLPEAMVEGSTDCSDLSEYPNLTAFNCINLENSELVERQFLDSIPNENVGEAEDEEPDDMSIANEFAPLLEANVDTVKNESLPDDPFHDENTDGYLKEEEFQNEPEMTSSVIAEEIKLAFDHISCAMDNVDPNKARFHPFHDENTDGYLKEEEFQNELEMTSSVIVEEIKIAFDHISCAMDKFEKVDPNKARFQAVRSAVHDMLACYREMFEEKKTIPLKI